MIEPKHGAPDMGALFARKARELLNEPQPVRRLPNPPDDSMPSHRPRKGPRARKFPRDPSNRFRMNRVALA